MKTFKKCKIVSLSKHFYIVSDDEIQVGDTVLKEMDNKTIVRVKDTQDLLYFTAENELKTHVACVKVIATTNPELGLPSPSKSFIEKYCEKGGIDEVMVEYTCVKSYWKDRSNIDNIIVYSKEETKKYNCLFDFYESKPVVDKKDNTITIRPVKNSWTKDEVIELLCNMLADGYRTVDINKYNVAWKSKDFNSNTESSTEVFEKYMY